MTRAFQADEEPRCLVYDVTLNTFRRCSEGALLLRRFQLCSVMYHGLLIVYHPLLPLDRRLL